MNGPADLIRPWLLAALLLLPGARAAAQVPASPVAPPASPVSPSAVVTASPISSQADMVGIFDQIFTVGLDLERPMAISGLKLKRDTMELTFNQGTLYFAKPIAGQVTGAYFKGSAGLKLTLPNAIDRKRMEAAIGKPSVDMQVLEAVLRFDDGADNEILAAAKPGSPLAGPSATWNDRLKVDSWFSATPMEILHTRINAQKRSTLFIADLLAGDGKTWFSYVHDGANRIEDGFYREEFLGAGGKKRYRVISEFHKPQDYDAQGNYDLMPEADAKDVTLVRNVDMTIEIPNTKSVLIDAHLTVEALRDNIRALRFDFINNRDDSGEWDAPGRPVTTTLVADEQGNNLPYLHRCHELLVLLSKPLAKGERTVVHVKATEDTVIQLTEKSYWIYTTYPWFPQMGELGGRYTIDWTVKVVKPLKAAGTGDLVKEWQEGDYNCARWKSDKPVQFASFIFGAFKETEGSYKRQPPATGEIPIRVWTIQGGEEHSKANPESIIFNIGEGIKTYETILGPYPYGELDVAEMAKHMGFAQAPAGVMLVSTVPVGVAFDLADGGFNLEDQGGLGKTGGGGTGDQFVFHELAHQWWGHQISWVSPEDEWISESWAEYTSGLMIAAIDAKRFEIMRKKWRQYAIEGDPYGTLASSYRSESPEHPGTRFRMVYNKGPYVVHMLRTWMGWEKFSQFVGTVQSKYQGTSINTDTLAREAGKVMGYDMFPFFDQWVRNNGVPKVHYSWTAAPDAEGKQVVTIKLRQEDSAKAKILMLPIALDFGQKEPTIVQKPMLKAEGEIQLRVPSKPKGVTLDPAETQLAFFIDDAKK